MVVSWTPDAAGASKTGLPVTWFTATTGPDGGWSWTGVAGALGPGGSLRVEESPEHEGVNAPNLLDVPHTCDPRGSVDGGCWQSPDDVAIEVMRWRAAHGWGPMTYPLSAGCPAGRWEYRGSSAASGTSGVAPIGNLFTSTNHFITVAGGLKYEAPGWEYGLEVIVYGGGPGEGWGVRLERYVCLPEDDQ